mgnify:CR=1 FL=1
MKTIILSIAVILDCYVHAQLITVDLQARGLPGRECSTYMTDTVKHLDRV